MRNITILNDGWRFTKTAADAVDAAQAAKEPVTLPHTWNAVDGQDGGNDYHRGTCWYVRELEKPAVPEDGEVWLELDGAAMTAEVYLNGEKLARHEGGYSAFRVNLTEHLQKKNTLAVSVDNSDNDRVYPQKADFTFYGGLYRDVKLITVPAIHFELGYCGTPGIKVTPIVSEDFKTAQVAVETWQNESEVIRDAQARLTDELDKPEFDEGTAKAAALALAAARFDALGSADYEAMRIQYILARAEQADGLDVELLRQITAAVLIHPSGAVSLELKNGQTTRSDSA